MGIEFDKGPSEVLRALASGNPDELKEALEFQRESFRAKFGCYPDELKLVPWDELTEEEKRYSGYDNAEDYNNSTK